MKKLVVPFLTGVIAVIVGVAVLVGKIKSKGTRLGRRFVHSKKIKKYRILT